MTEREPDAVDELLERFQIRDAADSEFYDRAVAKIDELREAIVQRDALYALQMRLSKVGSTIIVRHGPPQKQPEAVEAWWNEGRALALRIKEKAGTVVTEQATPPARPLFKGCAALRKALNLTCGCCDSCHDDVDRHGFEWITVEHDGQVYYVCCDVSNAADQARRS